MSGISGVDSGESSIYPINMIHENPEIRWSFIRKVYSITIIQLLLTIAIVSVLVFVPLVANFFNNYVPDHVLFIVTIFAIYSAGYYHVKQKHHPSYIFLLVSTASLALPVGLTCLTTGEINIKAAILRVSLTTTVVMVSLILFTFWAIKRGHDFNFLYRFRFGYLLVLSVFFPIQMMFLLGKLLYMIFGYLIYIIVCVRIVHNTYILIKKISYAQTALYIFASGILYEDVMYLFLSLFALYLVLPIYLK